jgi:membrane-associated phospholipid phosphatase
MNWRRPLAVAFVLVLAAAFADRWAYEHVVVADVYEEDWGRLLRVAGYWPLWLLLSAALVLQDWPKGVAGVWGGALARGWLLLSSVTASGIAGELLKLLFRRERPRAHGGEYFFRAFSERPFSSSGLALPSSHAIVAFGAAAMLSRLFPRAAPVWYLLAIGCGLTRVMAQAHFMSDIVVSFLVGWLVAAWLWRLHQRRQAALA